MVKMSKKVWFFGTKVTGPQYWAENRGRKSQEGKSEKFKKFATDLADSWSCHKGDRELETI